MLLLVDVCVLCACVCFTDVLTGIFVNGYAYNRHTYTQHVLVYIVLMFSFSIGIESWFL